MIETAIVIAATVLMAPLMGGVISGADRVLTARLQARVGPPQLQPFYDVVKLLGKEQVAVNVWQPLNTRPGVWH